MIERPRQLEAEADRALVEQLAAVRFVPPDELRLATCRAVERRLAGAAKAGAWRRTALVIALLAVSSAALALAARRSSLAPPAPPRPLVSARRGAPPPAAAPALEPPAPATRPPRPSRPPPRPHAARAARSGPPALPAAVPPAGLPPWPFADEDSGGDDAVVATPAPRLTIARQGQTEVTLFLAGNRVVGMVRGTRVDLRIERAQLIGKMGDRNVSLWLHGHDAVGDIGGLPARLQLVETAGGHQIREGYSVRSALPFAATRVETTATSLTWSPGCEAPLPAVGGGAYRGRCASGGEAEVTIPPSWQELPPLARLVLLSFFLTERDPAHASLFGAAAAGGRR